MPKQYINEKIPFHFDWSYQTSLEHLENDIAKMKELGVTDIEISYNTQTGFEHQCCKRRLETDKEFYNRTAVAKSDEQRLIAIELKELERLKAKYENGK
jgi:hypothetical protein